MPRPRAPPYRGGCPNPRSAPRPRRRPPPRELRADVVARRRPDASAPCSARRSARSPASTATSTGLAAVGAAVRRRAHRPPRGAPALPRGRRGRRRARVLRRDDAPHPRDLRRQHRAVHRACTRSARGSTTGAARAIVRVAIIIGMFVWLLVTTFQSRDAQTDDGLSRAGAFSPFVAFMLIAVPRQRASLRRRVLHGRPRVRVGARARGARAAHRASSSASARSPRRRPSRSIACASPASCTTSSPTTSRRWACRRAPPARCCERDSGCRASGACSPASRRPRARRSTSCATCSRRCARPARPTTPAPSTVGLDALAELVDARPRERACRPRSRSSASPVDLPDLVQVNIYRVAQEALTNARRHGGPDAAADVRLRYADDDRRARGRRTPAGSMREPSARARHRGHARARRGVRRHDRGRPPRAAADSWCGCAVPLASTGHAREPARR